MADSIYIALVLNAGLLISSTLILELVVSFDLARPSLARKLIAGTLLSLVGIAVMALPFELQPGVVFDVRSVLVSTATLFYGAVPGGMVMVASAAFRLAQGGAGAAVGVAVVVVSGALGILFRSRLRGDLADLGWRRLLLFGLIVHGAMLLCMLGLPQGLSQGVLREIALPVLTIYPALTVAVGQLMARRFRQERLTRDLADSEARFRSLFQDSHVMMFLIDPISGDIVDANPATVRHYGWTLDELRSMNIRDLDTASSDLVAADMARAKRSQARVLLFSHRRKDGSIRSVEAYSGPVRLRRRELIYAIVVDVTERQRAAAEREEAAEQRDLERTRQERMQRRARLAALNQLEDAVEARRRTEEALKRVREQQRLLRESQRVAQIGSWQVDLHDGRVDGTDEAFDLIGLDSDSFGGTIQEVETFLPDSQIEAMRTWFGRLSSGDEAEDFRLELRDADGDPLILTVQGGPVLDAHGTPVRVVGTVRDVTAEATTRRQIQKLSAAVEQSPESILITDVHGTIEYVNETFERTSGYSWEEAVGNNPRMLASGKTPRATHQEMWRTLTDGRIWRGEFVNRRKDGRELVELVTISPLLGPGGAVTHYVGIKEDITERKALAQELDAYRHRLEELVEERTQELRVQRERAEAANHAKGRFLANISHEIRTPMNAIVGLSHLLLRSPVSDSQREHLDRIDRAAHHLLSILNDVLDLSRIEEGRLPIEREDFELVSLLDLVHSILASQATEKGLELEVETSDLPTWLRGDGVRVRQALLNLVGNAVKFTDRGSVRLRANMLDEDEDGLLVRFEVEDTGPGIAPDRAASIFEAFEQGDVTTTRRYGGTGLGLAISKRLVELMGGTIGFESEVGRGSTFWIELRLQPAHGAPTTVATSAPVDPSTFQGRRVLVVEDNAVNREVAGELLSGAGFEVETASNGAFAVDRITAEPKRYDLIMMDVQMPVLDGLAATRRIRTIAAAAEVPIIAMTANAFDEDREASQAAGMNDFVAKPVNPETMFAVIGRWVTAHNIAQRPSGVADADERVARSTPAVARTGEEPDRFLFEAFVELILQHDVAAIEIADQHRDELREILGADADRVARSLHAFEFERAREMIASHPI